MYHLNNILIIKYKNINFMYVQAEWTLGTYWKKKKKSPENDLWTIQNSHGHGSNQVWAELSCITLIQGWEKFTVKIYESSNRTRKAAIKILSYRRPLPQISELRKMKVFLCCEDHRKAGTTWTQERKNLSDEWELFWRQKKM